MNDFYEFAVANPEYFYSIKLTREPRDGFVLDQCTVGKTVRLIHSAFVTTFDQEIFQKFYTYFRENYLNGGIGKEIRNIDDIKTFLIINHPDNTAEVYINFCSIESGGQFYSDTHLIPIIKQDETGTLYSKSFKRSDFQPIKLTRTDNWAFLISRGRTKGLYFNFWPRRTKFDPSIGILFKGLISELEFENGYYSNPRLKEKIFKSGWFPFIRIRGNHFNAIYNQIRQGNEISNLETKIADSFKTQDIQEIKESWMKNEIFLQYEFLFNEAIEAYFTGHYVCAIHILYPKIEGMMRFFYRGNKDKPTLKDVLIDLIHFTKEKKVGMSYQLPDDFKAFIKTYYCNGFSVKENRLNLSRHSLAHGTTKEEFTKVRAFQAILILDQISWYIATSS